MPGHIAHPGGCNPGHSGREWPHGVPAGQIIKINFLETRSETPHATAEERPLAILGAE